MLTESSRAVGFLSQFSRVIWPKPTGAIKPFSSVPTEKPKPEEGENKTEFSRSYRFKYAEFLPSPNVKWRNPVREKLERRDMLRRRSVIDLPEFYVGTIMAVTTSNQHATGKSTRFVGICILKQGNGLNTQFLLRNVVEHQGIEVLYSLYSPLIQKIEVLRLEKRLDSDLLYLRDAPNEYSTFPFDMLPEYSGEKEVPVNTIKVKLNPRPWLQRYERMDLKGAELPKLPQRFYDRAKELATPWKKYDLMDRYRETIPEEEQDEVFREICEELQKLEQKQKLEKKKKAFQRPTSSKQRLF